MSLATPLNWRRVLALASLINCLLPLSTPAQTTAPGQVPVRSLPPDATVPKLAPEPSLSRDRSSSDGSNYLLGAGDQIEITVYEYDEYTGSHIILPDGSIGLPLLGRVPAADRTVDELGQQLTQRLQTLLVNPVVTVGLTKLRPIRVNVAGEVRRPGPIQLQSLIPTITTASSTTGNTTSTSNPVQAPTLSSALLAAGGVTREADIRQVLLKRPQPQGEVVTTINLWDALTSGQSPQDLILRDGDSLFIPKLAPGDVAQRQLTARSAFAPKTIRVQVVGEVKKPGEVEVAPQSSLSTAVAIAGGPTDKAKLRDVLFVRLNDDGRIERKQVDLSNLADNLQVQEGDVIMVPKSSRATFLDTASQIITPLGILLNLFGL